MTCPRCGAATEPVEYPPDTVTPTEEFDRCPVCGWQSTFYPFTRKGIDDAY